MLDFRGLFSIELDLFQLANRLSVIVVVEVHLELVDILGELQVAVQLFARVSHRVLLAFPFTLFLCGLYRYEVACNLNLV